MMKYGAERERKGEKKDENMESQSRVHRHEITKNGIDVKIRDPYRYRSALLSFDRYIAAREGIFPQNIGNDNEKKYVFYMYCIVMYFLEIVSPQQSINKIHIENKICKIEM